MVTYNGALFISEQIKSIQMQSFDDWLLLVRDDGSTDGTIDILNEAAAGDSRITILDSSFNRGLGPSLNFGAALEAALSTKSDLFFIADQDDVWETDKLLLQSAQFPLMGGESLPLLVHSDLEVVTTLDPGLQAIAERAVAEGLAAARNADGLQAALVVLDPATGAVRALVGGRDYGDSQFNRAVQARRQPGSAFKPLVFLAALEAGWSPSDSIDDAPIRIAGWAPENIDGKFDGRITLAQALARSRNAATVRLQEAVGRGRVRALAERLGLPGPLPEGPSLALGTGEASPLEVAGVYAGIANGGRAVLPFAVAEVRDRDGRSLYERSGSGLSAVVSRRSAAALTDMLAATVAAGTGKAARLDRPAAGKTGTTQDYRDAWFAGFTADLVAVVWVGRDDNVAMDKVTGGGLPADIWKRFMTASHQGWPARPLPGLRDQQATLVEERQPR